MIQSYSYLKIQVTEFNEILSESEVLQKAQVQKIFSSPHFISIRIRFKGKTKYLYIGRGADYTGIFLDDSALPSNFRIKQDKLLQHLRKLLINKQLQRISLDENERAILLHFHSANDKGSIGFFWKGRLLYFFSIHTSSGESVPKIFCSWNTNAREYELNTVSPLALFNEVGRGELNSFNQDFKSDYSFNIEDYFKKLEVLLVNKKKPRKREKFLERKLSKINKDLQRAGVWKEVQNKLKNNEINFSGMNEYALGDKICKLHYFTNDFKKRDYLYEKVKALKQAENLILERKKNVLEELEALKNEGLPEASIEGVKVVTPCWDKGNQRESRQKDSSKNIDSFILKPNLKGWVGINAKGNDEIRSKLANKEDTWFHIDGHKGPHLVIKADRINIDAVMMDVIGSILIHYNKINDQEVSLIFTSIKNIKGLKGSPGAVQYKKEKYIKAYFKKDWEQYVIFD